MLRCGQICYPYLTINRVLCVVFLFSPTQKYFALIYQQAKRVQAKRKFNEQTTENWWKRDKISIAENSKQYTRISKIIRFFRNAHRQYHPFFLNFF